MVLFRLVCCGGTPPTCRREIAPTHFPAENGTYDAFAQLDLGNNACCTGTPVKVLDRNAVSDSAKGSG